MAIEQLQRTPAGFAGNAPLHPLQERLRGELIRPGDDAYDAARRVVNAAYDRYPALIARPAGAAGAAEAVRFARANGLPIAVRSGGHSIPGHGTADGALVIDLSQMREMRIDAAARRAWAQPGLTWGEYTTRAHAFGLATPAGDTASVGVAGLTLGGGIGWLVRKHGLTIDSLEAVELVTADGQILTASAAEHPDLFWALRGGGGNFGVATAFKFRLHPVDTILGGAVFYPATPETIRAYAAYASTAPDELSTIAAVMQAPPLPFIPRERWGSLVFAVMVVYAGDVETGQRAVAPLRALATPIADVIGPLPYPAIYDLTAEGSLRGRVHDVRSAYLWRLDDVADAVVEHARRMSSPLGMVQLRALGGAMARVPASATAFAHRDKPFLLAVINLWEHGDPNADRHRSWTEAIWRSVRPYGDGVYSNFLMDEGDARLREAYPAGTYERLARVKRQYDPDNVFRLNQNIRPQLTTTA